MTAIRLPARRLTARSLGPCAGVVRRQAWVAALMGLIAVAALQGLWIAGDARPRASGPPRSLPTIEPRGSVAM
ncbi:MAG TPA: hypothetical protein VFE63_16910 [Roseiarcus sp.]|nr:hypothetical protein [Roseiarcus sp.]